MSKRINHIFFLERFDSSDQFYRLLFCFWNSDAVGVTFFNQWIPALQLVEKV